MEPKDRSNGNVVRNMSADLLKSVLNACSLENETDLVNGQRRVNITHVQGISHALLGRIYVSTEFSPSCAQ